MLPLVLSPTIYHVFMENYPLFLSLSNTWLLKDGQNKFFELSFFLLLRNSYLKWRAFELSLLELYSFHKILGNAGDLLLYINTHVLVAFTSLAAVGVAEEATRAAGAAVGRTAAAAAWACPSRSPLPLLPVSFQVNTCAASSPPALSEFEFSFWFNCSGLSS